MNVVRFAASLLLSAVTVSPLIAAVPAKTGGKLRIAVIDVEGGQSTLFVSPTGQSLLVDTGWPGNNYRDADRIVAAAHDLGVQRIDTVVLSHYHLDHIGGVPQLVERIPVGTFIDHGEMYEQGGGVPKIYADYQAVLATGKYKHISVHAGEKLPAAGFDGTVISSDGAVLTKALAGAGQANSLCAAAPTVAEDTTENGHSVGFVLRFAGLKILDAGDLTSDRERSLVCPANLVGKVDLAIVSHHGSDLSSSKVFVHALHPRVAVMDNGESKGGSTSVIDTWKSAPGLEALFQLHAAPAAGTPNPAGTQQGGAEHNVPEAQIANRVGEDGKRIDVTVNANGSMDVVNGRMGQTQHFVRR
ncbi:MAG: ComEC/Rec2 family competence protein [Janthinobacterium lividum]